MALRKLRFKWKSRLNASTDQLHRFLLILTDTRQPAADVEEFRLACRTLQGVLPKQQQQWARSIGASGYHVWQARNIALVACLAFDELERRGLSLTRENFRLIRNEGRSARGGATPKKVRGPDAGMGADLVLMQVGPWSNSGSCRISNRRKLKLPWRIRLLMATPAWMHEARGRLRWTMSRVRNA